MNGHCSVQREQSKIPVAVELLHGDYPAYLSTEANLVPIRGVMRKEFFMQTRTHMPLQLHGPPAPGASACDPWQE